MTLHQCNISVSIDDVRKICLQHFAAVSTALCGTLLSGLNSPEVTFEQGLVSLSAKKKVPLLGELSVSAKVRPGIAADGQSLRLTLEKVAAGPLETGTLSRLIMSKVSERVSTIPECRVDGGDLLINLRSVVATKGVELVGRITSVNMLPNAIAISVA
jgi:hypothetical protein